MIPIIGVPVFLSYTPIKTVTHRKPVKNNPLSSPVSIAFMYSEVESVKFH